MIRLLFSMLIATAIFALDTGTGLAQFPFGGSGVYIQRSPVTPGYVYRSNTFPPNTYRPNTYRPGTYRPNTYRPNTYPPGTYRPGTYPPGTYLSPNPVAYPPNVTIVNPNPAVALPTQGYPAQGYPSQIPQPQIAQPQVISTHSTQPRSTQSQSAKLAPIPQPPPVSQRAKTLATIRVPGEFEQQRAIMLSVSDWQPHHFFVLSQIVEATKEHVNVIIMYNEAKQLRDVATMLAKSGKSYSHVFFVPLDLDTIWLRDFGPRLAKTEDSTISVDFFYEGSRPRDDKLPRTWATASGTRLRTVQWTLQGGNMLTNGAGLGVTSERIFQDNNVQFPRPSPGMNVVAEARNMVTKDLKRSLNLNQLVILDPLQQEATKHVDMFVTFLDQHRVLVAQLDPVRDSLNASILDRNAAKLRNVKVDGKPLEVHRIRIPPREGTYWSPLTNIVIANNLVLMPTFDSDDKNIIANAVATYRRLLPNHQVKTINMSSMKTLQGSLHCLTLNLPAFAPWPKNYFTFKTTVENLDK